MATNPPPDFCPYKGLQPYTEADRAYFFGRERDQEIIASNLYAAPLTILYGASGVGKTSVLLAGVVPQLRQTPRLAVVVFRAWQDENFLAALKLQTLDEIYARLGKPAAIDPNLPFDDFVNACASALRGNLFFILDQFEEYFLYHALTSGESGFDAEFARAINRREVAANFLLAMREEGLSRLDRFKGRIPNLLSNLLRLEHLDHAAAVSAIRRPLAEYNRQAAPPAPMSAEDGLVEQVIGQVKIGSVAMGAGGMGQVVNPDETRVETPYLQLVLTRLWDEERRANSNVLRRATFERLGGAQQIVRTHLDTTMARLTGSERDVAARAFRYLVTPSQTKIAYAVPDLADFAAVPQTTLAPVLRKLAEPDVRVLRSVAPAAGESKEVRYEIFHDVLAPAVLDWRERYQDQSRNKRVRTLIAMVVPIILLALAFSVFQSYQTQLAQVQAQVAQKQVQVAQAQVTAAQEQASAAQVQVIVEQQQAQAAQTQVSQAQETVQLQAATQTVAARALETQSALTQQESQAKQTQAANAAAISQSVLRSPVPGTTPIAVQATAIAVATSAAQVTQFEVSIVNVTVSPGSSTACPATFTATATIRVSQAGTVAYRWERSDGATSSTANLAFTSGGTRTVTETWTLSDSYSGWLRLQILSPKPQTSDRANFALRTAAAADWLENTLAKNPKVQSSLGCVRGVSQTITGAQQLFEHGSMVRRDDTRQIYVLLDNGTWSVYRDTWDSSEKPGGYYSPPPNLFEPQMGLGKVWREQLGGPKSKIGWANKPQTSPRLQIQNFERGFALITGESKGIIILFSDGKWTDL
jgi:cytoskeletal protein RodZ